MSFLQICSLARLPATVRDIGASHVLTLINDKTPVERPASIAEHNHLFLAMSDIVEPLDGHIIPAKDHVQRLLTFVRAWDRAQPMVIHCYAGVSRSTAAAMITACALNPARSEQDIANFIRAHSPTATPNLRLASEADSLLGRGGRLFKAAEAIGRGSDCYEGTPFRLEI